MSKLRLVLLVLVALSSFGLAYLPAVDAQLGAAADADMRRAELLRERLRHDREMTDGNEKKTLTQPIAGAVPAPGTIIYVNRYDNDSIESFDASAPDVILSRTPLTGLNPDEEVWGIDFRPTDGRLYGQASRGLPGIRSRLVTIDLMSGAVAPVHPTNTFETTSDTFFGFEFESPDVIRQVGDRDTNRSISPVNGGLIGAGVPLRYAAGDINAGADAIVVHLAKTTTGTPGGATLYGIDANRNTLVRLGGADGSPSPDNGDLTTIGSLGVDPTRFGGMDVAPGSTTAYASLYIDSQAYLVSVDLLTGAAAVIGLIGDGTAVIDGLAIAIGPIITPTPTPGVTPVPTPTPGITPTPTPPPTPTPTPTPAPTVSTVRVVTTATFGSNTVNVPIQLVSLGGESVISFTLGFDPTVLSTPTVSLGTGALPQSMLTTNTTLVPDGRIGVTLSNAAAYPADTRNILDVRFNVLQPGPELITGLQFFSSPTALAVTSASGSTMPSNFQPGRVIYGLTSAGVAVSGRVLTTDGRGVRNVTVKLTDTSGNLRAARTGSFGNYEFLDVPVGQQYTLRASSRRYGIATRVLLLADTITDFDLVAQ